MVFYGTIIYNFFVELAKNRLIIGQLNVYPFWHVLYFIKFTGLFLDNCLLLFARVATVAAISLGFLHCCFAIFLIFLSYLTITCN